MGRREGRGRRAAAFRRVTGSALFALPLSILVVQATASAGTPTVAVVHDATYGDVLATSSGLPLYVFASDMGGTSTCTGACLAAWPPLTVSAGESPTAGPGVTGTLAVAVQADGRRQVTYDGAPLYTFVADSPGKVTGQGVQDFFVVKVQAAPATSSTTTTSPPMSAAAPTTSTPSDLGSTSPTDPVGTIPVAPATAATGAPSAAPATNLAFTGPGTTLWVLCAGGLVLVVLGGRGWRGTRSNRRRALLQEGVQ